MRSSQCQRVDTGEAKSLTLRAAPKGGARQLFGASVRRNPTNHLEKSFLLLPIPLIRTDPVVL